MPLFCLIAIDSLHLGALNIVKLMNETLSLEFTNCLSIQDDNGMTPLHRAVLFNYYELASYLIQSVSYIICKQTYSSL